MGVKAVGEGNPGKAGVCGKSLCLVLGAWFWVLSKALDGDAV